MLWFDELQTTLQIAKLDPHHSFLLCGILFPLCREGLYRCWYIEHSVKIISNWAERWFLPEWFHLRQQRGGSGLATPDYIDKYYHELVGQCKRQHLRSAQGAREMSHSLSTVDSVTHFLACMSHDITQYKLIVSLTTQCQHDSFTCT